MMSPRTKSNLIAAMGSDAVDAARYHQYAARARRDESWTLARAFEEAANDDWTKSFAYELKLTGLIADTGKNLRDAIETEKKEVRLCRQFATEAAEDGDVEASRHFEAISRVKAERCQIFDAILADLGIHSEVETITDGNISPFSSARG